MLRLLPVKDLVKKILVKDSQSDWLLRQFYCEYRKFDDAACMWCLSGLEFKISGSDGTIG